MADHIFTEEEVVRILDKVVGKTLGQIDKNNVFDKTKEKPKITGIAGDVIEQSVFGYQADTKQEADLLIDGRSVELKTTGLKKSSPKSKSKYALEAKEPMSITAVSVDKIGSQDNFYESTLWHKLEELLLVYYLYDSDKTVKASEYSNFPIQGYQFLIFSEEDKKVLENDWKIVRDFVRNVEKNALDKSIEFPKISKLRTEMSYMDTAPKYPHPPRFRLTRSYVSTIVQQHLGKDFKPLYPDKEFTSIEGLKDILEKLGKQFIGKSIKEIANELNVPMKLAKNGKVSKSISSIVVAKMFSKKAQKIEKIALFNKFGIKSKTIVQTRTGGRTEDTKLLMVDFSEITDTTVQFEDSTLYSFFSEQKFLFSIFEEVNPDRYENNVFKGFKLISFEDKFIEDTVRLVWDRTRSLILDKKLELVIKKDKKGQPILNKKGLIEEAPNFPKAGECDVFLRGSGKDSTEKTFEINGLRMYPQFYWIKGSYLVKMLNQTDFLGKQ